MFERFPKLVVTWTRVRGSNDDRGPCPLHGAEMGSVRGADAGKLLELYILWQQKKSPNQGQKQSSLQKE